MNELSKEEELNSIQEVITALTECNDANCNICKDKNECNKFIRMALATTLMYVKRFLMEGGSEDEDSTKDKKRGISYFS